MQTAPQFSFRMIRTSYKSQYLVYEEHGHKLVIYLEMSGVRKFDWVGCDTAFQKWSEPVDGEISTTQQEEIRQRLSDWSEQQKVRIGFGPALDINKLASDFESKGWMAERDGKVIKLTSPKKIGIAARIRAIFGKAIMRRAPNQSSEPSVGGSS